MRHQNRLLLLLLVVGSFFLSLTFQNAKLLPSTKIKNQDVRQLINEANYFIVHLKLDSAEQKLKQAQSLYKAQGLNNDSIAVAIDLQKGKLLLLRNDYDQAAQLFENTLKRLENSKDTFYLLLGQNYKFLGDIKRVNEGGEHMEEAVEIYDLAIDYLKQEEGHALFLGQVYMNYGNYYRGKKSPDFAKADSMYRAILPLGEELQGLDSVIYIKALTSIAEMAFFYKYDFQGAIDYAKSALEIIDNYFDPEHLEYAINYARLANYYFFLDDLSTSIDYVNRSKAIFEAQPEVLQRGLESCYNTIGMIASSKGSYGKAIIYQEKALELMRKKPMNPYYKVEYAKLLINLGGFYRFEGQIEKALQKYDESLVIFQNHFAGKPSGEIAILYDHYGSIYTNNTPPDFDKGLDYFNRALDIRKEIITDPRDSLALIDSYRNISVALYGKKNYQASIDSCKKALKISERFHGIGHISTTKAYIVLAKANALNGAYDKAMNLYNKALSSLNYKGIDRLNEARSMSFLIVVLKEMAVCQRLKYQSEFQNEELLLSSKAYIEQSIAVIKYSLKTIGQVPKLELLTSTNEAYAEATEISYLLHKMKKTKDTIHLEDCFAFSEGSKAITLQEALRETNAKSIAGIPDSLIREELDLRREISLYTKFKEFNPNLETVLFELRTRHNSLIAKLEKEYPKYHKAKYDYSTITVSAVQKSLLEAGQTLLEYQITDSSIFIFLVQQENFEVLKIKKDVLLEQTIKDLTRNGIYRYYAPLESTKVTDDDLEIGNEYYTAAAIKLYDKLVRPIAAKLTDDLIIIRDGVLNEIPFEALLASKPKKEGKFETYDFMLENHLITYNFSATSLASFRQNPRLNNSVKPLLAIAPFANTKLPKTVIEDETGANLKMIEDELSPLLSSEQEVKNIAAAYRGEFWLDEEATVSKFKNQAKNYTILHLSTHGKANNQSADFSFLAFHSPEQPTFYEPLFAQDIYTIELNADLVFLSACETGIGKLRKGEGLISLARAFSYAGAKSLVTTLWKVSEEESRTISESFYKLYNKGKDMTKRQALQKAKMDYLRSNAGNRGKDHPFFWAGFVGIGNMN